MTDTTSPLLSRLAVGGVGLAVGLFAGYHLTGGRGRENVREPRRVFKLATRAEAEVFEETGRVESSLDRDDGFVHLSGACSVRTVAALFFKDERDLVLLEIDSWKFGVDCAWENDPRAPDSAPALDSVTVGAKKSTTVHHLYNHGCVHVYGARGVLRGDIVRSVALPLGPDGHAFPEWLY